MACARGRIPSRPQPLRAAPSPRVADHGLCPSAPRTLGNQALQRLLRGGTIEAKLPATAPGDACERQAERVAKTYGAVLAEAT